MKKGTAYYYVQKAIADGQLQRGPCEICGDPATQGHHDNYSKPLAVRWLCRTHHTQWHKENPSPPRTPANKAVTTIYLSHGVIRRLEKAAESEGVSMSIYIEQTLRARLKKDGIE